MDSDFELDMTLMCRSVGKSVSDFVAKNGVRSLSVVVTVDEPDVSYDGDGLPHHGVNVRVYVDLSQDDE